MANENRLIDANALINHMKDLPTRYEDGGGSWLCLDGYPKGMFDPEDVISSIENAPTVDAVPVSDIEAYLQARLDEWEALGDRKWEQANMWGYNFIMACFDDLERRQNGETD